MCITYHKYIYVYIVYALNELYAALKKTGFDKELLDITDLYFLMADAV